MEWLVLLQDENIMKVLSDYTIVIGIVGLVAGIVVKHTKTKLDDKILDALKGRIKVVKK